jgi:SAM-dependent methyltransferase
MIFDKEEWFKDWFDSPYYHLLYTNRDFTEAEFFIDNLIHKLNPLIHARILDLACGKGRHSIYLAKKGFDVTGLDISPKSISYASQFENSKLSFYVHDMRKPFRINYYNIVLNMFTSFGYFNYDYENMQVIRAVKNALVLNGLLVIDFMNSSKVIADLVANETKEINGIAFHIKRYVKDKAVHKEIAFTDKNTNYCFGERVQALTLTNFKSYFNTLDMEITHLYGDYNFNDFNENTSERLIIIAKKIRN